MNTSKFHKNLKPLLSATVSKRPMQASDFRLPSRQGGSPPFLRIMRLFAANFFHLPSSIFNLRFWMLDVGASLDVGAWTLGCFLRAPGSQFQALALSVHGSKSALICVKPSFSCVLFKKRTDFVPISYRFYPRHTDFVPIFFGPLVHPKAHRWSREQGAKELGAWGLEQGAWTLELLWMLELGFWMFFTVLCPPSSVLRFWPPGRGPFWPFSPFFKRGAKKGHADLSFL